MVKRLIKKILGIPDKGESRETSPCGRRRRQRRSRPKTRKGDRIREILREKKEHE